MSIVSPREVFLRALLIGASSIILIHNHPSKESTPSTDDMLLTKRIKQASDILGIPLDDHIIIAGDSFLSMKECELL